MCNLFKKNPPEIDKAQKEVLDNKDEMIRSIDKINKMLEDGSIKAEAVIKKINLVAKE